MVQNVRLNRLRFKSRGRVDVSEKSVSSEKKKEESQEVIDVSESQYEYRDTSRLRSAKG